MGVLIEEVLNESKDLSQDPDGLALLHFVRTEMKAEDPSARPSLDQVLRHQFFDQTYLKVVDFLSNLAFKTREEKDAFFREITRTLFDLPEKVVASQLTSLLLSRIVLLEQGADQELLPSLLCPAGSRRKSYDPQGPNSVLCDAYFKEFVVPQLTKIFGVRDTQIRMTLLRYFHLYFKAFPASTLQLDILPLVLLGIRDTDNDVVAWTLRALADLTPVLGASVVVGKNRVKVFTDCSPSLDKCSPTKEQKVSPIPPPFPDLERKSPIGAENSDDDPIAPSEDHWDKWDEEEEAAKDVPPATASPPPSIPSKPIDIDLDKLDIKVVEPKVEEEDDLFADMEPVIPKAKNLLELLTVESKEEKKSSKFAVQADSDLDESGWGADEEDAWGNEWNE